MRGRPRSNYRNQPRFPVTLPRGPFRSFSGRRSPHANRKRNKKKNVNEVPIPYNYTDTQKWQTFYTNGRGKFHKNCILLCDVSYGYVKDTFWKESHSHIRGEHAEVKAMQRIMAKERDFGSNIRWVTMYLSYSPCANCADRIIQFSWDRPQCDITIAFSCLFRHTEKLHHDGLRRLHAESRITIKVFTKNDWKRLAQETDIDFTVYAPRRDQFDAKWRAILRQILSEENEYTKPERPVAYKPARMAPAEMIINNHIVPTQRSKPYSPSDHTTIQIFQTDSQDIPQNRRLQTLSITVPRRESHTSPSHPDSAQGTTNNETRIEIEEAHSGEATTSESANSFMKSNSSSGISVIQSDSILCLFHKDGEELKGGSTTAGDAPLVTPSNSEDTTRPTGICTIIERNHPLSITNSLAAISEINGSIQGLRRKKKKQIIIITSFVILIAIVTILICIFCV